jgi:hypothetical protein
MILAEQAVINSEKAVLPIIFGRINLIVYRASVRGRYYCLVRNVSTIFKKEVEEHLLQASNARYAYKCCWISGPNPSLKIWWQ